MDSFFFIPGSKLSNLDMILSLQVSEIIIDLEDALRESERLSILDELKNHKKYGDHYLRVPFTAASANEFNTELYRRLLHLGYRKFVFPKLASREDFQKIIDAGSAEDLRIILLVETPRLFLEAKELLLNHKDLISGVGLGSHDFMSVVGGVHELENLYYLRQHILYLARMINTVPIDIASMELNSKTALAAEITDGFRKGYEAKFFIHPWQLEVLREINFYSREEYQWALSILRELDKAGKKEEFQPVVINGQVIEKPHLDRVHKIVKYYRHEG